jgi:hypothetical protein
MVSKGCQTLSKFSEIYVDSDDPDARASLDEIAATEPPPFSQAPRVESCARCGALGHSHVRCRSPIPSFADIQAAITRKIDQAIASPSPEWVSDEFGLHISQQGEANGKSGPDGDFCFNCGTFGHTFDSCPDPSFEDVANQFGDTLNDRSARASLDREAIISSLSWAHLQRLGERDQTS